MLGSRFHRSSVVFAQLALLAACERSSRAPGRDDSPARGSEPTGAAPPAPSATQGDDASFAAARATLERWRDAQQKLDFAEYAALYAEGFRGIKRVGEQRHGFDRKRWLLDRKAMFVQGLTVKVSDVRFTKAGEHTVVSFLQEFSTPSYRDRGRKVLVLAPGPTGLRIAREELLDSTPLGGGGSVSALPGFFVARPDAVVLRSSIDERWLTNERRASLDLLRRQREAPELELDVPEQPPLVTAEVSLPPEVLAMQGKSVFVWRAPKVGSEPDSSPCEAQVTRVDVTNVADPSFESVRSVWADALYGVVVLGKLSEPCPGALWASERPDVRQYPPKRADDGLTTRALRAFAAQSQEPWGGGPLRVTVLGEGAGQRLVVVSGTDPAQERSVTALFELLPKSDRLHALEAALPSDSELTPRVAFDLDRDGKLELLVGPDGLEQSVSLIQTGPGRARATQVYSEPAFQCPG